MGATQASARRFCRRLARGTALNHPNTCSICKVGEHAGQPFIAMDLVEGETPAGKIRVAQGPPSDPATAEGEKSQRPRVDVALQFGEMLEYAIQIADALAKAHRQGIVHRYLTPANILRALHCLRLERKRHDSGFRGEEWKFEIRISDSRAQIAD